VPYAKYTEGMKVVVAYSEKVAEKLGVGRIAVKIINDSQAGFSAAYGSRELTFNVGRLGYTWFNNGINHSVDEVLLRELAGEKAGDRTSKDYYEAICQLGAQLKHLALTEPDFFKQFELDEVFRNS
jgi:hypothetical protein